MDEIIKSTDNRYSEYETLLFFRDKLRKEAYAWKNRYLAEFGNLITAVFEQKIACIKKKKTISFCQMAVNRGKPVDQAELQNYLSQEMKEYNRKLSEMIQENEIAHSGEIISEETAAKIKKLYYRLAKQIHPDMNPKTNEIPELKELWQRIVVSYRANDLEELEEAEILVNKFLVDHHLDGNEIKIQDIDTKIEKLKEQIQKIKETNPYQYRFLLQDQEAVQNKKLLQPLAENAIDHGIDVSDNENPTLWLTIREEAEHIFFEIRDNGAGMTQEKADQILTYQSSGYGVRNVCDRIHVLYGEKGEMKIESTPGKGTRVFIRIPKNTEAKVL